MYVGIILFLEEGKDENSSTPGTAEKFAPVRPAVFTSRFGLIGFACFYFGVHFAKRIVEIVKFWNVE